MYTHKHTHKQSVCRVYTLTEPFKWKERAREREFTLTVHTNIEREKVHIII